MEMNRAEQRRRPTCAEPGWRGSWPAALLAASIFSSCFLLTRAQGGIPTVIRVTWTPPNPTEGHNMTLTPGGTMENVISCSWYRGTVTDLTKRIFQYYLPPLPQGQINGPAFTGRETAGPECSLHIRNLTSTDSGNYTVTKEGSESAVGHATIEVSDGPDMPVFQPLTKVYNERSGIKLSCQANSFPDAKYIWFVNGKQHNEGPDLLIQNITWEQTGIIPANANATLEMEVVDGPHGPIIEPQEQVYVELSTLNHSCSDSSNPPANYSWFHNVELLEHHNSPQLLIWPLSLDNTGNYTCNATSDDSGHFNYTHLEISILEYVTNITIWGPESAFEKNVTVLNCISSGTNVSYYWLKGNQRLEVGEHISLSNNSQTLQFNPTSRNDSGVYTCYGNNSFSSENTTHSLDVFYGPDVPVISPNTQYYAKGSNLNLSCKADSNPPALYTWHSDKTVQLGDTFQLLNLSLNDTGNYTCEAFSNKTFSTQSTVLEIWILEILSRPILSPENIRTVENKTVVLHCKTSNNSRVIVSWLKDGKPVPGMAGLSDQNRTLTLPGITKDDAGNYTCVAKNLVSSETSNSANIVVEYGPYDIHLNESGSLSMTLGSHLALLCTADSFPPAQFRWLFNNTDQNVLKNTFSVQLNTWESEGTYTCQAHNTNTNRTTSASVTVKLKNEDHQPGNVGGLSSGEIAGIVIGCLVGVALISGLLYFLYTKTSLGRTEQHTSNGNIPSAPSHNQGVSDTKPRSLVSQSLMDSNDSEIQGSGPRDEEGEEDVQYSTLAFNANNPPQPASGPAHPLESNIIYSEIKKK